MKINIFIELIKIDLDEADLDKLYPKILEALELGITVGDPKDVLGPNTKKQGRL